MLQDEQIQARVPDNRSIRVDIKRLPKVPNGKSEHKGLHSPNSSLRREKRGNRLRDWVRLSRVDLRRFSMPEMTARQAV